MPNVIDLNPKRFGPKGGEGVMVDLSLVSFQPNILYLVGHGIEEGMLDQRLNSDGFLLRAPELEKLVMQNEMYKRGDIIGVKSLSCCTGATDLSVMSEHGRRIGLPTQGPSTEMSFRSLKLAEQR